MKNQKTTILYQRLLKLLAAAFLLAALVRCGTDSGGDTDVNNVTITAISPGSPVFNEIVTITYDYKIDDPDGVRIWVQPYTNGSISPGYSYTSSPLITGNGSRTVRMSVVRGEAIVVDQLAIKIANADGTELISERFENVNYTFDTPAGGATSNQVTLTAADPSSPAMLTSGSDLKFDYAYTFFDVPSIKLDVELMYDGKVVSAAKAITPFISGGASPLKGSRGATFSVTTDSEVKIDQIRFFAEDTSTNEVFYESFVDVDYTYTK